MGLRVGRSSIDPCATIRNRHPTGGSRLVTVRAGLFTTTGNNVVLASCLNGGSASAGAAGTAPLQGVFDAVRPGPARNGCIFTVSPTAMPVWSQPFPLNLEPAGHALYLNHTFSPVDVAQFGHGETGQTTGLDRDGFKQNVQNPDGTFPGGREHAYDIGLSEGTPLYAIATARYRRSARAIGTSPASAAAVRPHIRAEIYIKNVIGSSSVYQDSFVALYAHTRRSLVVPGQSVKTGQLIGFSGRNGCSGGVHLHLHTSRDRNVNAHKVGVPEFGYKADLEIDPVGNSVGNNFFNTTAIDSDRLAQPGRLRPVVILGQEHRRRSGIPRSRRLRHRPVHRRATPALVNRGVRTDRPGRRRSEPGSPTAARARAAGLVRAAVQEPAST